jgi:hypothetical protein
MDTTNAEIFEPSFDPFSVNVTGKVRVEKGNGVVKVTIHCDSTGDLKAPHSEPYSVAVPLSHFKDDSEWEEWAKGVYVAFRKNAASLLMNQMAQIYIDVLNLHLGIAPAEVVKAHVRFNERFLRKGFGLPWRRGNFSPWTKIELEREVTVAIQKIPKDERKLDSAVNEMRKNEIKRGINKESSKVPKSGESLGKLLKTFEISWKHLKEKVASNGKTRNRK